MIIANSGLGKETAIQLARRGGKIYLACRSEERGLEALKDVKEKSENENVHFMQLDLGSFESIREFSRKFHEAEQELHVLLNNAALMASKQETKDGQEMNIGVNHLGHFLLTNLLLDLLKAATPSRVIIVSSNIHKTVEMQKDFFDKVKSFNKWKAYSLSKLANVLFMRELSKKLDGTGVSANAMCPGPVDTEAMNKFNIFFRAIMWPIKKLTFKSVEVGAETHVMLAVEPAIEAETGKYFRDCKILELAPSALNEDIATWLWDESVKITGL